MTSAPSDRFDTVSFLSDYGRQDEFVGVVHSVIRSTAPHVTVIDITHDVPRHDVRAGGLTLARSAQYLCPGVVLAVVDPGVGTARRAIAVEVGDGQSVLVGPDNGLLAPAVAMVGGATAAVSLTNTEYHLPAPGPTFDGRDVFAPVAAALCAGADLRDLGEEVDVNSLTPGILPVVREEEGDLLGRGDVGRPLRQLPAQRRPRRHRRLGRHRSAAHRRRVAPRPARPHLRRRRRR